jgi:hypothetical protein
MMKENSVVHINERISWLSDKIFHSQERFIAIEIIS